MTREAKIGMLTGLGVILLIGVLLSDYLGGGAAGAMSPTGRMATLPLGAAYRQEVTEPVGVPGTVRSEGTGESVGTVTPVMAVPAGQPSMSVAGAGPMVAGDMNGNGPTVGAAVSPVASGDVRMDAPLNTGSLPTLQLADANNGVQAVYVAGQAKKAATGGAQQLTVDGKQAEGVKGQEYVIVSGDTLGKIAAKFYKTSKGDAVARIVAANPLMLKSDKTMLVAGKKLMIPNAPVAAKAAGAAAAIAVATAKKAGVVVIHQPGVGGAKGAEGADVAKVDAAKKVTGKVYVVVSGDTFEKIAKKLGATDVNGMVKKLESVNGVKDPTSLQVGQKLKVPG